MGEAAPPAYSPEPPATAGPEAAEPAAAGLQDANPPADQPPVVEATPLHLLGDQPQCIDCPFCQHRTTTRLDHRRTPMQIFCGVLILLGGCVWFSCLPCLCHWFEETNYYCSQCHEKVASLPNGGPITVYGPGGAVPPSKYPKPVSG